MKSGPERDLCARYQARLAAIGPPLGFSEVLIREIPESRAGRLSDRQREEAVALRRALPPDSRLIALDERGKNLASAEFAMDLSRARDTGAAAYGLAIGGPDGLDSAFREAADFALSFGSMTWPHQLVRILALEQLYRAATILAGHPYHRA